MATTHLPHRSSVRTRRLSARRRDTVTERDTVVARVAVEARDRYRHSGVPPEQLDRLASEAVDALWTPPPRVSSYIPILALRLVGERIARTNGRRAAIGGGSA